MEIGYLADHPDLIPLVADWIYHEWSFLYPGKTARYIESLLRRRLNKKELPLTLIAFVKGRPAGTISLKKTDLASRRNLSPWVTSLYVKPEQRRKGIGKALLLAAESKARELHFRKLHLFTAAALVPFYAQRDWTVKESLFFGASSVCIMEKKL